MNFKLQQQFEAIFFRALGFTLIEMLSGMGILSCAVVLLLPTVAHFQRKQDDVVCLSNLRQIGVGIQNYALDNGGILPGPLYTAQYPYRNQADQLSYHLLEYLSLNKSSQKLGLIDVFVCPAYRKAVKRIGDGPVYTANVSVPMNDATTMIQPFGYANSKDATIFGAKTDYLPLKIVRLADIVDSEGRPAYSSTWALKDIDQEDERLQQLGLGAFSSFPRQKVHRNHRNALFFDFHVASVDYDRTP